MLTKSLTFWRMADTSAALWPGVDVVGAGLAGGARSRGTVCDDGMGRAGAAGVETLERRRISSAVFCGGMPVYSDSSFSSAAGTGEHGARGEDELSPGGGGENEGHC